MGHPVSDPVPRVRDQRRLCLCPSERLITPVEMQHGVPGKDVSLAECEFPGQVQGFDATPSGPTGIARLSRIKHLTAGSTATGNLRRMSLTLALAEGDLEVDSRRDHGSASSTAARSRSKARGATGPARSGCTRNLDVPEGREG